MAFFLVRRIRPRLATIAVAVVAGMTTIPLTPQRLAESDVAQLSQENVFMQVGKAAPPRRRRKISRTAASARSLWAS